MSFLRRPKNQDGGAPRPDSLDAFLAEPPEIGTSDADVEAVAKADAEHAADDSRIAEFVETEGAIDRYAPRPSVRD